MRFLIALICAAALSGCGFHLRGSESAKLPYQTLHIALPDTAEINVGLQRQIRSIGTTQLIDSPKDAEAIFVQLNESRAKSILSVNAQGRVREFRLILNYRFHVVNAAGKELVRPNEIGLYRDVRYDDSTVLAKNIEETLLWRDMTNDLVNQIVRRLATIKPRDPNAEDDE